MRFRTTAQAIGYIGKNLMEHSHGHEHHRMEKADGPSEQNLTAENASHSHHQKEHTTGNHEAHTGHDHHGMIADFRRRFWLSLILAIPVVLLSPMVQEILHYSLIVPGQAYISFLLSSVIFFYGGWPFLKGLVDELRGPGPGMMSLIAVAITVAYLYSSAIVFGLKGMDFFWELATLIVIMLLGHWIEMKSVAGASRALELLVQMMPSEAHLLLGGNIVDVKVQELEPGQVIVVKPGEKVPADGRVVDGSSFLDESMLTGESVPVKKEAGAKVIGGSVNGNGSIKVEVEHSGADSYLQKVIGLVDQAQHSKSNTQHLADRAARWLTYLSLGIGVITLIVWLVIGKNFAFALERMVTVMVISCPHALGLAIPLVVAISTAVSARNGLLIRNRTAFENARKITTIVFDKTGTLTMGSHEVMEVVPFTQIFDQKELLRLAAGVEQHSEHYISAGIMREVKAEQIEIPQSSGFNYMPGHGLEGKVEGKDVKVVGPNYIKEKQISFPTAYLPRDIAQTLVYVIIDGRLSGYIALADKVRQESAEAVKILKDHRIKNLLLTGDNEAVAQSVSDQLRMDGYMANVLPHQKLEKIKELQEKGEFVAMTGDGVNDAPALAQADVGIAVGSGTDVAAETADIILVNSNPLDIANLIMFGKATYRKMIQNLIWATAYNAFAIPLAAGVLYSTGFILSPAIGAVFMSLSTIIVALNAQLLRRKMQKK